MRPRAIILAAGASRRMGRPKALLPLGEGTFLSRIAQTLREAGIDDVMLVLGADAEPILRSAAWFDGTIVVHRGWEEGQLSSLLAGLNAAPGAQGPVLVWPVDRPFASAALIGALLSAFDRTGKGIVVPLAGGRRGHPILFGPAMLPALRAASPLVGAREVLHRHPELIEEVPTEEVDILRNIDTPEDLAVVGSR